jgi:hypothetical protein
MHTHLAAQWHAAHSSSVYAMCVRAGDGTSSASHLLLAGVLLHLSQHLSGAPNPLDPSSPTPLRAAHLPPAALQPLLYETALQVCGVCAVAWLGRLGGTRCDTYRQRKQLEVH